MTPLTNEQIEALPEDVREKLCPFCQNTGIVPHGDGYSVDRCPWTDEYQVPCEDRLTVREILPFFADARIEARRLREEIPQLLQDAAHLQDMHRMVLEMCESLGLNREDVPCDAWALNDAIQRLKNAHEVLKAEHAAQAGGGE